MKLTNDNYVDEAERVMQEICQEKNKVTTSKIRNILAMISDIYNDIRLQKDEALGSDMRGRIQYLKLHMVYEAGREKTVKEFLEKASLLEVLDSIKDSRERLILFCHYMEALVAYRKFYGRDE